MSARTNGVDLSHFTGWLAHGERGLSSEAIVRHLTGQPVGRYGRSRVDHPHDPSDFRRCQLLLEAHPLARLLFPGMRTASPEWSRLVDRWDDIDAAIRSEVPEYLHNWQRGQRATAGYRLMRCVIEDADPCGSCDGTGNGPACEKCKGTGKRSGGRCRADGCWWGYALCSACRGRGYVVRVEVA